MTKYQLCMQDEYGQTSIIDSSNNLENMVKKGKGEVHNLNVENALTVEDKKRNWEAYFVEIGKKSNFVYGHQDSHGKKFFYHIKKTGILNVYKIDEIKGKIKIYLGNLDKEDWYGEDVKKNPINLLDHRDLIGKTVYFIKVIS